MENVIIVNPNKLEEIKNNLRSGGPGSVHILSDFDRTLTYHCQGGQKNSILIAVLQEGNYLPPEYGIKVRALYEKYYPIEINPNIPLAEKKAAMTEWYRQVFALMISFGLTKEIVERAVKDCRIKLRDGVEDWLDFIERLQIPLVIFSSSGLGGEAISIFLDKLKKHLPDIHVLANSFIWDETGKAIGVNEPIMHPFNKDETLIHNFPFFAAIKNRRNVILFGDSLGDVGMVEGFAHDNLLKIGFLNGRVEENLESFKQVYDVIILGDVSFAFINQLFKEIF
ncbi:MAG: hypothetical protein NTY31_01220 [Candidatus Falkowbacteria bacterium]|nr:hypothetical protein [Candidatus Falkowbacteria bacterium]